MTPALVAVIAAATLAYLIAGLHVSRAYWRENRHRDTSDVEINAAGILLTWPLVLAGYGIVRFVKWFYSR